MKRICTAVVLALVVVLTSLPLFHTVFFRVHDYTHAARISEMARGLLDGQWPVRWSQNLGYGYGMPLFNFYAPLPYFIGAVVYVISTNAVVAIKFLFVISNVLVAIGTYKVARMYLGRSGALLAAVLVTLAPYRALNLYIRGAVSEAWALSFLPWIYYYGLLLARGKWRIWPLFSMAIAALALTHNITFILATPLLSMGIGFDWLRQKFTKQRLVWSRFWLLVGSGIVGVALAAFYIVPAMLEKSATKLDLYILDYYFNYQLHFLYIRQFFQHHWQYGGSGWGPTDDVSFGLGIGQLAAIALTGLLGVWQLVRAIRTQNHQKLWRSSTWWLAIFLGGASLFGLYMTLEKSLWIWETVKILEYAQFPWRWLNVAILFIGLLGALGTQWLPQGWRWLITGVIMGLVMVINTAYFQPEKYLTKDQNYYSVEPAEIRGGMSSVLPDYIPAQMPKNPPPITNLIANQAEIAGTITVLTENSHQKLIRIKSNQEQSVIWSVADFPGWQVELDGQKVEHQTSPNGLITAAVSPGEHLVGLQLTATPTQWWSHNVSLLAGLVVAVGAIMTTSLKQERYDSRD